MNILVFYYCKFQCPLSCCVYSLGLETPTSKEYFINLYTDTSDQGLALINSRRGNEFRTELN